MICSHSFFVWTQICEVLLVAFHFPDMFKIIQLSFILLLSLVSGLASGQSFYKEKIPRNNVFSIGIGPSFAYLDNGGQYKDWNFEIKPSISASYSRKINSMFDLRGTVGYQQITSGGNPPIGVQENWIEKESSFTAKGSIYFLDVIPSMNLIPYDHHMNRSKFNIYGGIGLGVMLVATEQTKSFEENETPTSHTSTIPYLPIRAGLSYRIGKYADIAGEGTILWTFTDTLDGNAGSNRYNDQFAQAQIVYRRYLVPKSIK